MSITRFFSYVGTVCLCIPDCDYELVQLPQKSMCAHQSFHRSQSTHSVRYVGADVDPCRTSRLQETCARCLPFMTSI